MCLVRTPGGPDAPAEDAFGLGFFVGALAQGHSRPRPEAGVSMIIGCAAMMKVFIGYTDVSASAT